MSILTRKRKPHVNHPRELAWDEIEQSVDQALLDETRERGITTDLRAKSVQFWLCPICDRGWRGHKGFTAGMECSGPSGHEHERAACVRYIGVPG